MIEFISSDYGKIETKAGNVVLKKKSPLFGTESIEGDLTFPFTIPMTDELRAWLKHPERIEAVQKPDLKNIQIKRNGISILSGELKIGDADDMQVETTFVSGSSPFASLIKDLCLDQLDLGFQSFADEAAMLAYWNASVYGSCFTHEYYLPTIVSNPSTLPRMNNYVKSDSTYLLEQYGNKQYMTPMLYYAWLLPKVFEALGYEFEDRVFINNADLQEMLFFNLHDVNAQQDPLTIKYADLLPHYKLSTWLIDIQNALGVNFLFDNGKQSVILDWQVSAINNASKAKHLYHGPVKVKALDEVPAAFSYNILDSQGLWASSYSEVLPSVWEKKDLPNAEKNVGKYCYVASDGYSYLSFWDTVTLKYIWGPYSFNGINLAFWDNWPMIASYITGFFIGDTTKKTIAINSNICPFHTSFDTPIIQNFNLVAADEKTLQPYVLFAAHELAGPFEGDAVLGYISSGEFTFGWLHNDWLMFNKILPWWEFLRNTKQIETTILVSDVELANWDWTIPILINNIPCLVDEMEVPLSDEGEKMQCKITAWRL